MKSKSQHDLVTAMRRLSRLVPARPWLGLFGTAALATGCAHIGPQLVAADRFDYSSAIADSWKQQTLLNIVKIRYMDLPVFVDVASIVSGYSLETGVSAGGSLPETTNFGGNTVTIGGSSKFTDRPTITYVPLTGERFLRGLVTPIDPKNIFFMLQAGYPADFILGLTVEGLNGVRNRSLTGGMAREADPEFVRALELLHEVQAAGAVGMRVEEDKVKGSTALLFFRRDDVSPEIVEKTAEIRRLLKLAPEEQQLELVYSPVRGTANQLAVNSRSMLQIMQAFAGYTEVPEQHLKDHRAVPAFEYLPPDESQGAVRIRSGKDKPEDAFASIFYRGYWFWVDDGDWKTKRALTAVMFFFTLTESGDSQGLPLITIPTQ
jgi:hypothetical protein